MKPNVLAGVHLAAAFECIDLAEANLADAIQSRGDVELDLAAGELEAMRATFRTLLLILGGRADPVRIPVVHAAAMNFIAAAGEGRRDPELRRAAVAMRFAAANLEEAAAIVDKSSPLADRIAAAIYVLELFHGIVECGTRPDRPHGGFFGLN